jgi:tRNA (mo5U34)-methyltransferase
VQAEPRTGAENSIPAYSYWHYQFDLNGVKSPVADPAYVNRHAMRERYFLEPLVRAYGGSLRGKRVLDLGCNSGFWSLKALAAGADFALGVEGRPELVNQARYVASVQGVPPERARFEVGDIFQFDYASFPPANIVFCLGLMYHVCRPVELLEKIASVNTEVLVIDTTLSQSPHSYLEVRFDDTADPRNAIRDSLVFYPSCRAVIDLAEAAGYCCLALRPEFESYLACWDYRCGSRRAFLCLRPGARLPLDHFALEERDERGAIVDDQGALHRKFANYRRLEIDKKAVRHESGLCYVYRLPSFPFPSDQAPVGSPIVLRQGDRITTRGSATHEDIRRFGGGLFSHWNDELYFSTLDNAPLERLTERLEVLYPAPR